MKTLRILSLIAMLLWLQNPQLFAQRSNIKDYVRIEITPDSENWTYKSGEKARFTVRVVRSDITLKNVPLTYEIGPEKMKPVKSGKSDMKQGYLEIDGSMDTPGFLTCVCKTEVDGISYTNYVTVGFSPEQIKPTTTLPDDFRAFWERSLNEAAVIPMEPVVTLMPDLCTSSVNVYHVRLQHYKKNSYIYGVLAVPVKPGKYPAVLKVPGAGVKKQMPDIFLAEKGIITFSMGINGIPQTLESHVYNDLRYGVLDNYAFYNLDDKDHYYYRRVYTGCIRSLDFICSLPEYDGVNLAVSGGSQGGALAIVTTALDQRVKALVSFHPALCDLTGYLHGRAGGWPAMFAPNKQKLTNKPDKIDTSRYYDVVNFARFIRVPGYYSWGFNDPTCPPTSLYSAYNVISAPKELFVAHDTGHWRTKEQDIKTTRWLLDQLGVSTGKE